MTLARGASLLRRLRSGERVLGDGAVGTSLIAAGWQAGDILQVNRMAPEVVTGLHRRYLGAGAQTLTANTFGLRESDAWWEDCVAGLRLATAAAEAWLAPIGVLFSLTPSTLLAVGGRWTATLREAAGGAGTLLVETCVSLDQAARCAAAARTLEPELLVVTGHFTRDGLMPDGAAPATVARALKCEGADVVGANCGDEPHVFRGVASEMAGAVSAPVLIQPGVGAVREPSGAVGPGWISPEDFGLLARDLWMEGARWVGGCCGTTPRHIAAASDALTGLRST